MSPWSPPGLVKQKTKLIKWPDFSKGCGHFDHVDGGYSVGTNVNTMYGSAIPGPLESVDRTGIAAGFRVIKKVRHNDVPCLATTDSTDTKIYRLESAVWALKATFSANATDVCTDMVSFTDAAGNSTLIIFFGSAQAFEYSTNDGTGFTTSIFAGNAKYGNFGLVQSTGLPAPRCLYAVNPNMLFYSANMAVGGSPTTSTPIDTASATDNYFTSLEQDDTGETLIGMRRALWTLASDGIVNKLTRDFEDSQGDADGQSDRRNFENPQSIEGRIYYPIHGYNIMEYYHGQITETIAPRYTDGRLNGIPRLDLPINAMVSANGWLVVALGSKNTGTLRDMTHAMGGTVLLQNTFATTSELYAGRYETDAGGKTAWVWHGSFLTCTDPLRYMWFDEDDEYLYLASGDAQSSNSQQERCYFFADNPLLRLTGSAVVLTDGTATIETGRIMGDDMDSEYVNLRFHAHRNYRTDGANALLLRLYLRNAPGRDTAAAYETVATWNEAQGAIQAEEGFAFPSSRTFLCEEWLKFELSGGGTGKFPILRACELTIADVR